MTDVCGADLGAMRLGGPRSRCQGALPCSVHGAPDVYPIGTVIVLHHADEAPSAVPGATWFRIQRGWVNAFGSEVPLPWSGTSPTPPHALTVMFSPNGGSEVSADE